MVKFSKNKLKILNKTSKAEKSVSTKISGKVTKKKSQVVQSQAFAGKKASVIKELASKGKDLVELKTEVTTKQLRFAKSTDEKPPQPKKKPVEKQKKRQKTQINDTKMLLKLMNKK